MDKNLRKLVEDELTYGRHQEVMNDFTQSERQLYESQDFEWTGSGYLVKKKDVEDYDYDWTVLAFCENNPDLAEQIKQMLDSGERLLRNIYTDRDTFNTWSEFFQRLNAEGFCLGDYVDINDKLSATEEDAMSYADNNLNIESVGQRGIYHVETEEVENEDWLGELIDPYQQYAKLPRDKYRTVGYVGFNEPEPEGVQYASRREERLNKLLASLNGTHHRPYVAKIRNTMSARWAADKNVYKQLKNKKLNLNDASEKMYLTAKQWKEAFRAADQAWLRACLYDEKYFSQPEKKKRQLRSNSIRNKTKVLILNAQYTNDVERLMTNVNGDYKLGLLWKNDYKELYSLAAVKWQTLNKQGKRKIQTESLDSDNDEQE